MILALPRSPHVSWIARDAIRRFADELGARRSADACLLVSELVTNAYLHGQGQIRLTITLHDHVARFAVDDEGRAILQPTAHPDEHGGWGLNIVARVADHWGTGAAPTHVWFELHTPSRPATGPAGELLGRAAAEEYATDDPVLTAEVRSASIHSTDRGRRRCDEC